MSDVRFTVGIPVHNALPYVQQTIKGLENTYNDFELVIVADNCDDETLTYLVALLRDYERTTKLFISKEQKGFPYSCNLILKNTDSKFTCLLNSDVYTPKNWDKLLVEQLEREDCIVGPTSCRVWGKQQVDGFRPFQKMLSYSRIGKASEELYQKYKEEREEIECVGGFCFCLTKGVIGKVGYFDERFGLGSFEETDYCNRAKNLGFKNYWVKGSYVHHYGKGSFRKYDSESLWQKNELVYFQKRNGIIKGEVVTV